MTRVRKLASLVLAGFLIVNFLSYPAGAAVSDRPLPGQSTQEWYIQYMQQYAGYPSYQPPTQATQPAQPSEPAAPTQPQEPGNTSQQPPGQVSSTPGVPPVQPQPGELQDTRQWYLDYLRQYQQTTPTNTYQPPVQQPPSQPAAPTQPVTTPSTPAAEMPEPVGLTLEEAQIFAWINEERVKAGKAPVKVDLEVVRLARLKAEDVATYDYYGHTSPTYGTPGQMLTRAGYRWAAAGETIAKAGSIFKAHNMLMASSSHRKIILSEDYTHLGLGIARYQGRPGLVLVELFVRPY